MNRHAFPDLVSRGKRLKFSSSIQRGAELAVMETSSFKKKVRNVIEVISRQLNRYFFRLIIVAMDFYEPKLLDELQRMVSKKSVADLASNASAVT